MKNLKLNNTYEGVKMNRVAFTMIELVMVIVVLGILASLALPRMDRDLRQEAETNILAAIHYTQNLALSDNKTDPRDPDWQKELWQMRFRPVNTKWFYTISTDINHLNGVDKLETAIDTSNGKYMFNGTGDYDIAADESPNIFLSKKYGINSIVLSDSCAGSTHIAFDHLGRPHANLNSATNTYSTYLKTDCTITFGFETSGINDLVFTIKAETGYVTAS